MSETRPIRVHRVVIDSPPTKLDADCWQCGRETDEADREDLARDGHLLCDQCGYNLTPAHAAGTRRNYLNQTAARKHVDRINRLGGSARVATSDPVVFP